MKIPTIRKRLHELAEEYGIDELHELAEATRRKAPIRRAPARVKNALTVEQKAEIRHLAETFPHMAMREIARRVGTDQGRISEYLNKVAEDRQPDFTLEAA